MMARVQTASTSSRMCVEMTMAFSDAMALIRLLTSCFWLGSKPSVGSSMINTSGSCNRACAMPTRRLNPLDKVSTVCSTTDSSRICRTISAMRACLPTPLRPRTSATKSRNRETVISAYTGAPSGK